MHILLVDNYPGTQIGGGERHLLTVAEGCRAWGHRVGIVCLPDSGLQTAAEEAGFEVHRVGMRRGAPGARTRLARLFSELRPDVVHVHGFHASLLACPAARDAAVPRVLVTVHNMPSAPIDLHPGLRGRLEFWLRSRMYRSVARSVDTFVCVVTAARDELIGIGLDPAQLVVIPNAIPDPALSVGAGRGSAEGALTVGSVGRLELLKGYVYFVRAVALAIAARPDARYRLVGDGRLRGELQAEAGRLGISDSLEFAGWSNDPLGEIAAMDVYVVSSVTDTTNLTVLEAMGLGRPVVATDVGGIGDAVIDGVTGYLVAPRDPEALAARIVALLDSEDLRATMGQAGRRRWESHFTEERMLEAHRALYGELRG